jgi:hypothetical protein
VDIRSNNKGKFSRISQGVGKLMTYCAPTITDHGSLLALTQASPNDGEDPCRFNEPRNEFKQTGNADYILGQSNLGTCIPSGSV